MPVDFSIKLDFESSISRHAQMLVPKTDKTFTAHTTLSLADLHDQDLIDASQSFTVTANEFIPSYDNIREYILERATRGLTITEPDISSVNGEYGKVHVKLDKKGHLFLFDFTPNNERILLKHPKNGYIFMAPNGDTAIKVTRDYSTIVGRNAKFAYLKDHYVGIEGSSINKISGEYCLSTGDSFNISSANNAIFNIKGGYHIVAGGAYSVSTNQSSIESIGKEKKIFSGASMSLETNDTLYLTAKKIVFTSGSVSFDAGGYEETSQGLRAVSGDAVRINGVNQVDISSGGPTNISSVGYVNELITNASVIPSTYGKRTQIMLGNYELKLTLGDVLLDTLAGALKVKNAISGLTIDTLGVIKLYNALASLKIDSDGSVQVKGTAGSINIDLTGTITIDGTIINLGQGASHPAVNGDVLVQYLSQLTVGTGVGVSTTPLVPPPTNLLSTKVMIG